MPKIVTDYEHEQTRKAIIKHTHQLIIEKKGIKNITVDDIIRSVGIGKSTFYSIYKSKEICFCDVIEKSMSDNMAKTKLLRAEKMTSEERTTRFFNEIYLCKESIAHYISPIEMEVLFRRLPPEYSEKVEMYERSEASWMVEELGYDESEAEAAGLLLGCVDMVAAKHTASTQAKEEALRSLIQMMVNFFKQNKKDNI